MKLSSLHPALLGEWSGEKSLWFDPKAPPHAVCPCEVQITSEAMGKFLALRYRWSFEGQPQSGLLLVGNDNERALVSAAWVDSFHSSGSVMHCRGEARANGFLVLGSYAASPGPDWGWDLVLQLLPAGGLELLMHNIPPGGSPELAVRILWER